MKLIITGGHLTPALALIQELSTHGHDISFIGRTHTSKDENSKSQEQSEVENLGCTFIPFSAPKLKRHQLLTSIISLPSILGSIAKAVRIIKKEKPEIVVSFGGYLAVPVAIAAKMTGTPLLTHEQTTKAGLANRTIAKLAEKVAISFQDSQEFYTGKNTVLTGNPVRKEFIDKTTSKPSWLTFKLPMIYITGGNQGSLILNRAVTKILPELLSSYTVVMQVGTMHQKRILKEINELSLSREKKSRLYVKPWFTVQEVSYLMHHAKCVISRSGANTVTELMVVKTPSILIPLKTAQKNEQLENAKKLTTHNAGILLHQTHLSPNSLLNALGKIEANYAQYKNAASNLDAAVHKNAAKSIHQLIHQIVE